MIRSACISQKDALILNSGYIQAPDQIYFSEIKFRDFQYHGQENSSLDISKWYFMYKLSSVLDVWMKKLGLCTSQNGAHNLWPGHF